MTIENVDQLERKSVTARYREVTRTSDTESLKNKSAQEGVMHNPLPYSILVGSAQKLLLHPLGSGTSRCHVLDKMFLTTTQGHS